MREHYEVLLTVLLFAATACSDPAPHQPRTIGDQTIKVFDSCNVQFDMAWKETELPDEQGVLHLDAGRVVLTRITVPHFDKHVDVSVRMRLVSNGDPWDKAGSLFVLPGAELPLFKQVQEGIVKLDTSGYAGVVSEGDYAPAIELLRFMTPFGIGHWSDTARVRPPVYVPLWEKSVTWEADISNLLPVLEGEVWVGCYIDTWTKEGDTIDVDLLFDESEIPGHLAEKRMVLPLCNTIKYMPMQEAFDGFHHGPLEMRFTLPDSARDVQLHYTTTGHGGHETGDEFVKKENRISLDGEGIAAFTPWRDDCASFRRFNPTSGVWRVKTKNRKGEIVEESLASSDISRSGWCPGSQVEPMVFPLSGLRPGQHTLSIAIPDAQAWVGEREEFNHWLVSAYVTWRE